MMCAQCGQEFTPRRTDAKTCGDRCRQQMRRDRLRVTVKRSRRRARTIKRSRLRGRRSD